MREKIEIPSSVQEIFHTGEASYSFLENYKESGMDNIEAMRWFIESVNIPSENIVCDDGTQIIIQHPDFKQKLVVDSYGKGDFHSHGFDVSFYQESENN